MRSLRHLLISLVAYLGLVAPCQAASLEEAITQLKNWHKRIITIRVQYRRSAFADTSAIVREFGLKSTVGEVDWIWEDTGRFRDSTTSYNDGHVAVRDIRIADFKQYYHLGAPADNQGSEYPARVTIYENSLARTSAGGVDPALQYLWNNKTRTWLGDRLPDVTESSETDDGLLKIDGSRLAKLICTIYLDPRHGYLPVKSEMPEPNGTVTRYTVEEFRELEPGFWFPWKGSNMYEEVSLMTWEMTRVDLNTELPNSLFVPPMGNETYVHNTLTGKQYWHGGKPPARVLAAKAAALKAAAAAPVAGNPNPLTGVPDRPGNWSMWLVVVGIVCVSGGVWIRRRG